MQSDAIIGQNKYGDYRLFIVTDNENEEYSFFVPNESVFEKLNGLNKWDQFDIVKTVKQNGKGLKTDYEVKLLKEAKPEIPIAEDDIYYKTMEKAFENALKIQNRFNGMANVNQLAVTIYISMLQKNQLN